MTFSRGAAGRIAPPLLELRQYRLHPGRRDELVELFETELLETQEAVGITVVGQFRDVDRPDHFVWMRAFPDADARVAALTAFYDGPVWAAHRDRANATMIDSDDVLQLLPHDPDDALRLAVDRHDPLATEHEYTVSVVVEQTPDDRDVDRFIETTVASLGGETQTLGLYVTDPSPNGFPRLPVRIDRVTVWIGRPSSTRPVIDEGPPGRRQVLRLAPTARSLLR
jgi:hypothetical protein